MRQIFMLTPAPLRHDVTLTLPSLPSSLDGLRIVHISDLHCARLTSRHDQLIAELQALGPIDLAFFTGDYMNHPGDEPVAQQLVLRLLEVLTPRYGTFGIFGNHDSIAMRERLQNAPIHWLNNQAMRLSVNNATVEVMGFAGDRFTRPDAAALLMNRSTLPATDISNTHNPGDINATRPVPEQTHQRDATTGGVRERFLPCIAPETSPLPHGRGSLNPSPCVYPRPALRLLLSHYPTYLPTAADLKVDVMFSGHTHGGQLRLPFYGPLYNSSDLPLSLSSGLLRCRNTLAAVSRGLGETFLPIRCFCPPQLPVYELHHGPMPGSDSWSLQNIRPW